MPPPERAVTEENQKERDAQGTLFCNNADGEYNSTPG